VLPPDSAATAKTAPVDAAAAALPDPNSPISDFARPAPSLPARPTPQLTAVARAQIKVPPHPKLTGHHASGSATWYCRTGVSTCRAGYPGGLYAAAGPALRVGAWQGRMVRVCGAGSCVWVTLIDWCACGSGHIIDLYSDAFRWLAPLSSGAVRVTVSW
jgi:rare lipoprotein A (peptidoglycan hydrolase)